MDFEFLNFSELSSFLDSLKTLFGFKSILDNCMSIRRQYLLEIDYETDLAFNKNALIDEDTTNANNVYSLKAFYRFKPVIN